MGGLNSYTDCEQVLGGLKQDEYEDKKDVHDESEVDVEVLEIGISISNSL